MRVYRITGKKYAHDLSGIGAALNGGRWNRKGTPILYTGENKEIALLETVVNTPPMLIPNLDLVTLEIPDDSIREVEVSQLPDNWADYPAPRVLAELTEEWIREGTSIALKVPSCIIPTTHNYILNCRHPEYARVRLIEQVDFPFDRRLVK